MKKIILFFVFISGITMQSFSQTPHADTLSINNIKALVRANGMQFWEPGSSSPVYQYPNASGKNTIFSSCLWYGGKDISNQIHLAAEKYSLYGTDFWAGPLKTNGTAYTDTTVAIAWNKVWKVNKQDLLNYIGSTSYPNNPPSFVLNWPAHGDTTLGQSYQLAPFVDINNNGKYEPYAGDYPKIYGDQCIFFIINDKKTHYETSALPLGIEIHVFAYAFNTASDSALNNSVFYKYKVINRSSNNYYDFFFGLFADLDIGGPFDDYMACSVERGSYYGYNGTPNDAVYGAYPPAQGVTVLGGPTMDADTIDNPDGNCDFSVNGLNFGDGTIDNERIGMSRFMIFENSNNPIYGEPMIGQNFYNYLKAFWKDGSSLKWGGKGWDTVSTTTAKFMFPGYTDSLNWGTGCGTRPTPNVWAGDGFNAVPYDIRGLASMGPVTFNAGATQIIDVVYSSATDYSGSNFGSVQHLLHYFDHIRNLYLTNPALFQGYVGVSNIKQEMKLKLYPNPATDYFIIEGLENKKTEFTVLNLIGQSVKTGIISGNSAKIAVNDIKPGIYFIKLQIESETRVFKVIKK